MKPQTIIKLFGGLVITMIIIYLLYLREMVSGYLQGNAPEWFGTLAETLYPRLLTEKTRFTPDFFVKKADQLIFRLVLSYLVLAGGWFWMKYKKIPLHISYTITPVILKWLHALTVFLLGLFTWDWYLILSKLTMFPDFYTPPLLLKCLPFPSAVTILVFLILLWVTAAASWLVSVRKSWWLGVSVTCFFLLQGFLYAFHKVDHTYATFNYALLFFWLTLFLAEKQPSGQNEINAWPLYLIQIAVVMVYFLAGLEKLLIAPAEWLMPDNFRTHLLVHPTPLGQWVSQSDILCGGMAVYVLLFELFFPLALLNKRIRNIFLIQGILFHTGTFLLLHIGWYLSPWTLTYLYFFKPEWRPCMKFGNKMNVEA